MLKDDILSSKQLIALIILNHIRFVMGYLMPWTFPTVLKTFSKNFALVFLCMFRAFIKRRDSWVLEAFPHFWQSKLLPQNFTCVFILLIFLNNQPHRSKVSIFIPSLALELYSYKKQFFRDRLCNLLFFETNC